MALKIKKIHLDFSSAKSWSELTQEELIYILQLRTQKLSAVQQKAYLFFIANKIIPIKKYDNGWTIVWNKIKVFLEDWQLIGLLKPLSFLDDIIPSDVVSVSSLHGVKGVNPYLAAVDNSGGLIFEEYLSADADYQLYLQTQDPIHLEDLAKTLYPGITGKLKEWEQLAVLLWWSSVKLFLSKQYQELFRPAPNATNTDILAAMNGQIRGLTGGDVTKEDVVKKINVHRALTELDAKAREVRELKERINKDV